MKYLQMEIKCCEECPFVIFSDGTKEFSDDTYYCYCDHPQGHMDQIALRNRNGTPKDMTDYIHPECPLPDKQDPPWSSVKEINYG
jgi:hypothetical protein